MALPVKFGGGGSFSSYMERRRRGVAAHYQRKYAGEVNADEQILPAIDAVPCQHVGEECQCYSAGHEGRQLSEGQVDCSVVNNDEVIGCDSRDPGHSPAGNNTREGVSRNTGAYTRQINDSPDCALSPLFKGCHFYIDGVVHPYIRLGENENAATSAVHAHEKLIELIVQRGGHVEIHLSDYVTHYVVERVALGCSKWWNMRERGGEYGHYAIVTPAYVFECHIQDTRLPEREFLPASLRSKSDTITLTQRWRSEELKDTPNQCADGFNDDERPMQGDECGEHPVGQKTSVENTKAKCDTDSDTEVPRDEQPSKYTDWDQYDGPIPVDTRNGGNYVNATLANEENGEKSIISGVDPNNSIDTSAIKRPDTMSVDDISHRSPAADKDVDTCVDVKRPASETVPTSPIVEKDDDALGNDTDCLMNSDEKGAGNGIAVDEYYKRSRLHLLGTWKTNVEKEFAFEPFTELKEGMLTNGRYLHIDMDAFFVSVALRSRPHLKNLPLAISHGTGRNSASEISTCNYEARSFGVRKGMWVRDAIKRCPLLKFVPYDFDAITDTALKILRIVAGLTKRVYSASCDELYVECFMGDSATDIANYINFAHNIAQMIERETGCPLSVGIGANMMLSKLASQRCKSLKHGGNESTPGCYRQGSVCAVVDVDAFMESVPLRELPGVGYRAMALLQSCGYVSCSDVHDREELKGLLGDKLGNTVYQFCRGLDYRNINTAEKRSHIVKNKTISAAINYGVRVTEMEQVHEYMRQLISQTWERVEIASENLRGQEADSGIAGIAQAQITLKLRVRSPEASVEPAKYMGCGLCDEYTASVAGDLLSQKSVLASLKACWKKITAKQSILLEDLRGIALSICRIKRGSAVENNTIDRFLVTVTSSPSSVGNYPVYRDTPSRMNTPQRSMSDLCTSDSLNDSNSEYKESILRFMQVSPRPMRTPVKRKRSRCRYVRQLTIHDVLSGSTLSDSKCESWSCHSVSTGRDYTITADDRTKFVKRPRRNSFVEMIPIMPSLSSVWVCDASIRIIEQRLRAIWRAWPIYNGVVNFYREIFANYATILGEGADVAETSNADTTNTSETIPPTTNNDVVCINEGEGISFDGANESIGRSKEPCREKGENEPQENECDHTPHNNAEADSCDLANSGHIDGEEPALDERSDDRCVITPFQLRRVCVRCRAKFFKSFDIGMLCDVDCNADICCLPRLKSLKRCKSEADYTAQAITMVICTLVYATLLRAVVQLSRKGHFDVLQVFIRISLREAVNVTASFVRELNRPLQTQFFAEAQSHLLKAHNLSMNSIIM
ncbi:ImpB/MucB/SamB family protein, putative [Babesia bigemina]|uniref:ImpB/MucB/SamB family protein, putative n=1 Tax=Babesia bigemina TaxID=5866 RepID=A0A061D605_BABBI|nr:ImpB/MucB/SamB family protein, putative [Babesia bigemina]CDR96141.1 ImpB/MucB/SamB family protein, putative [Babesia bigemina]|eukprot:XP_012768327.1 ImpB/MucB/SamB family protein, putative [Babesia bigemina]